MSGEEASTRHRADGRVASHLRRVCGSRPTRNAELDIKWSGGLGTTAVVAPAVQRPPLQLIYIKLPALRFIVNLVVLD